MATVTKFEWDFDDPLGKAAGESKRANAAFRDYAMMGAARSLKSLAEKYMRLASDDQVKPPTLSDKTLFGWSLRNAWQDRVARFDELEHEARMLRREQRQRQLEDADWATGQELRDAALNLLGLTLQALQAAGGDVTALNITPGHVVQMADLASKLQRLSTNEPTDNVAFSGAALDAAIARELAKLANGPEAGDVETAANDAPETA